jgi:hypothetical protein
MKQPASLRIAPHRSERKLKSAIKPIGQTRRTFLKRTGDVTLAAVATSVLGSTTGLMADEPSPSGNTTGGGGPYLLIKRDAVVISDIGDKNAKHALIGQRINLEVAASDNSAITDITWGISTDYFDHYVADNSNAEVIASASFDGKKNIDFCWKDPGIKGIVVTARLHGVLTTAIAGITVYAPVCNQPAPVIGFAGVATWGGSIRCGALGIDEPTVRAGIMIDDINVTYPAAVPAFLAIIGGTWQLVQKITTSILQNFDLGSTLPDGSIAVNGFLRRMAIDGPDADSSPTHQELAGGSDTKILDTMYPYLNGGPFPVGTTGNFEDSPHTNLSIAPAGMIQLNRNANFRLFVLFKPPGVGSEWVGIYNIGWTSVAAAQKDASLGWIAAPLPAPQAATTHTAWVRSFSHPLWNTNVANANWNIFPNP